MRGYHRCRACNRLTTGARHCSRCGKCKTLPLTIVDFSPMGCCKCPSDRRPTGTKTKIAGGGAIGPGEPDGPAVPIPRDPYAP